MSTKANKPFQLLDEVTVYNPWSYRDYKGVVVAVVPAYMNAENVIRNENISGEFCFREWVSHDHETYIIRKAGTNKLVRPLACHISLDKRPKKASPTKKPAPAKSTKASMPATFEYLESQLKMSGKDWSPIFTDNAALIKDLLKSAIREVLAEMSAKK